MGLLLAEVPAGRGSWQEARCERLQRPMPPAPGLEACPCLSVRPRCVCSCLNTCRLGVLAELKLQAFAAWILVPRYVHARYMVSARYCEPCRCTERRTKVAFCGCIQKSLGCRANTQPFRSGGKKLFSFRRAKSVRYRSSPDKVPFCAKAVAAAASGREHSSSSSINPVYMYLGGYLHLT
jgi:hypothetical protein